MDPTKRLQVLQSSSPSIRIAAAPAQPTINIQSPSNTPAGPTIVVPQGPAPQQQQSAPASYQPYTPPQHTSFWGHVANVGKDIAKPFIYTGEDVSNAIGNAEVGIAHALGLRNDVQTQTNAQQFGDINHGIGIENQDNNLKNFAGNVLQVGAMAAAPFTGGGSLAADAAIDAGLGATAGIGNAMTQKDQSLGSYIKNGLIGGAFGAGGRFLGAAAGKVFSPIANKMFGKASSDALSNAVAQEGDAGTIQAALNTTPDLAHFLAQETNPDVIKSVLNEAGTDTSKSALQALQESAAQKQATQQSDNTIGFLDPMNPKQSQLPAGWHPDNAPDPVPVLENAARSAKTVEDFKAYIDGLQGEDKAAAESALNTMTPEQFYAAAGGGTQVADNTAAQVAASQLPESDVQAIKAAGGTAPAVDTRIPDTTIHLPSKGIYAKLTPEQAAMLANEVKNVKSGAGDIVHLSALTDNLKTNAKEVTPEEIAAASPNAKSTLDNIKPADTSADATANLPKEDEAAIKAAGGTVPEKAAAVEATPEAAAADANPAPMNNEAATPVQPDVEAAKQNVLDAVRKNGPAVRDYNKAAVERSAEKGTRSASADAVYNDVFQQTGDVNAALAAKMKALQGEYSKSKFGIEMSPEDKAALIHAAQTHPDLMPFEKTNAQTALHKLDANSGTSGVTPYDIKILRKAFGEDFGNAVQDGVDNSLTTSQKLAHGLGEVAGLPKSVMASFDLSGTLRQGGVLASRFPKEAAAAFKDQLKYFGSDEAFQKGMAEIASRPSYQAMLDSKLAVTGTEALDKSEEQFMSNLAEKIPGLGRGVAASDRAYTGFLTKLRADVFDKVTSAAEASGNPLGEKEMSDLAKFINTASGRGDLGMLEEHAKSLSTALFSPRLWKSRLDMLNPVYYAKLSGPARSLALQSAGTFAAEAGAVLGLMSLVPGVTVESDPRSADFGKIKIGNTRLDILGGFQQNIVFAAREISGQTKNSQTGEVTQLGQKFGGADRLSVATDMIQNKENPLLSTASQLLRGKDRGGNPINPWQAVAQLAVPLPISGAIQTINDRGSLTDPKAIAQGLALDAPDFLGISSQTYGSTPTKYQGKQMPNGQKEYTGPVNPDMVTDANGKVILDANGKPVTVKYKGNETDLEKQAMMNHARDTAYNQVAISKLNPSDAEIYKVGTNDPSLLNADQKAKFDQIKKWVSSYGKATSVPQGAQSDLAKQFYQKYNSMDANDQKAWLKQAPDQTATAIADQLNKQKSAGLDDFKPSNELSKMYAEFENDINSHPEYTQVDLRNKAKAFQIKAAGLNYGQNVTDIYNEGGSSDLKTLIANKKISQDDLNNAIAYDDQLFKAGLESSLKFSKKFRNEYGFATPSTGGDANTSGGGGGSSSGHVSQQLASLVRSPSKGPALQHFSSAARDNPQGPSIVKFRTPSNAIPSKGGTRVTASPFRTTKVTTLRNSVGI